jgi:hypothetical protein
MSHRLEPFKACDLAGFDKAAFLVPEKTAGQINLPAAKWLKHNN